MKAFVKFLLLIICCTFVLQTGCGGGSSKTGSSNSKESPPVPPSNLQATTISNRQIAMTWDDNSDNENRFKIYRCEGTGCSPNGYMGYVYSNLTSYTDNSITSDVLTTFCYKVCAYNTNGEDCSNISCVTTIASIATSIFGDIQNPMIAMDSGGNAIVVWEQYKYDPGINIVWAIRYNTSQNKWEKLKTLIEDQNPDNGDCYNPQVAMDSSGNAIAVWERGYRIYARRYKSSDGLWESSIIPLDDGTGTSEFPYPQIAMNSSGNAIAVWQQNHRIYSRRYANGQWEDSIIIPIDDGTGSSDFPKIAIDSDGNAIAVWLRYYNNIYNIYANRYISGGWTGAFPINTSNGDAENPQIAMNPDGNAFVIWSQYDENLFSTNIFTRKYNAGSWGPVIKISPLGDAHNPHISINVYGNAVAVWEQDYQIYASYYITGNDKWDSAVRIDTGTGDILNPKVTIGSNGTAIALWEQYDGSYERIYMSRCDIFQDWITATPVLAGEADAFQPQIAISPSTDGKIAVWYQSETDSDKIYAKRFE